MSALKHTIESSTHQRTTPEKATRSQQRKSKSGVRSKRSGVAAVEAAFCFPLIIVLMLGTLEITSGLYLRESLSVCSFEACRVGTRRGATAADVRARALEVLTDRQVSGANVVVTPNGFDDLKALDKISVEITAPTAGNSIFVFDNLANRNVTSKVTMIREFDD